MDNLTLHQISADYAQFLARMADVENEVELTDDELGLMGLVREKLEDKMINYGRIEKKLKLEAAAVEARAKLYKAEYESLMRRSKTIKANAARLMERLTHFMKMFEIKALKDDDIVIKIGRSRASVGEIAELSLVSLLNMGLATKEEVIKPDKKAMLAFWKENPHGLPQGVSINVPDEIAKTR